MMLGRQVLALILSSWSIVTASLASQFHPHPKPQNLRRQYFPTHASDFQTFKTPTNVTIRYKEPGKSGVCETTEGVASYSGYIDIAPNVHAFFWFFASRRDPANDDLTLWLNGGGGTIAPGVTIQYPLTPASMYAQVRELTLWWDCSRRWGHAPSPKI